MMSDLDFGLLLAAMAAVSFGCRASGFFAMRFVLMTRRVEAALRATPIAVMAGIVAVAALRGGPAEWIATAAVIIAMRVTRNDILSAFVGVGLLAGLRAAGI